MRALGGNHREYKRMRCQIPMYVTGRCCKKSKNRYGWIETGRERLVDDDGDGAEDTDVGSKETSEETRVNFGHCLREAHSLENNRQTRNVSLGTREQTWLGCRECSKRKHRDSEAPCVATSRREADERGGFRPLEIERKTDRHMWQ